MAKDRWSGNPGVSGPSMQTFPITAGVDFANGETTRGIIVGTAGDLVVTDGVGGTSFYPALAAGMIHPIRCSKVLTSGTYGGATVTTTAAIIQGCL